MPDYDGFYALEKIKKIDANARIIVVTGDLSEETLEKLRSYDVSIIYKPYNTEMIKKIFNE